MIWLAYFAIPVVLVSFARRRTDLPFKWMFWLFGAFIIGCGTTHLMEVVTTYTPLYRLAGVVKALTAAVSLVTAVALVPLVPRALLLRGPAELEREIDERRRAEVGLRQAHQELERRVQERTAELAHANEALQAEVAVRRRAEEELQRQTDELRLAQRQTAESLALVDSLLMNAPVGVAFFDHDLRFLRLNPALAEIDGLPVEAHLGRPLAEVLPGLPDLVIQRCRRVLQTGQALVGQEVEGETPRAPGRKCQWLANYYPVRTADGTVMGLGAVVLEVTERRQAEEALRESERRYRSLAEALPQLVWTDLPSGECDYLSSQWGKYTGIPEHELLGYRWLDVLHPDDRERTMQCWRTAVADQGVYDLEYRLRRHDGQYRWFKTRGVPIRDPQGHIVQWFGTCTDVEDFKRAEAALQQSEARFRQLADLMPQLAWMANPDGHIYWYNRRWYEYTGTTLAQMEGWGWQSVHDPEELPKVLERWKASIASGRPFDMVFPLRGADGQYRPFLTRGMPLRGADGRILHWFGTNTDISEQKRIEEEIRRLNAGLEQRVRERTAELEAANKELEAFSYSVSHDLRAPLRAIDGFSRILLQEHAGQLTGEGCEHLRRVRDNTRQMGQLVDDLLAFARLSRQPIQKQTVAPAAIVAQCLEELRGERAGRQVEVTVGELPACAAEPALLKQVWVNLIANALKYTRRRAAARVEIGCRPGDAGGAAVYYVKDNGVGFDMRYAEKLFGVFQRLHRAEDYEGTGVGLAIVQRIVHRHGGRVWAEGQPDRGATFFFTLGPSTS